MDIVVDDFNKDDKPDLLLFGNNYTFRNDYGRSDAKPITLLLGKGDGTFVRGNDQSINTSSTWGEYRSAQPIVIKGSPMVIAIRNNASPILIGSN